MTAVLRRVLAAVPTALGVATLVFFFLHWIPGDPVEVMLGETASAADRARLRHALDLDRPLLEQYRRWVGGCLRGDLGRSLRADQPVTRLIAARAPATAALGVAAAAFAVALALPLGLLAARRPGGWLDGASAAIALLGVSIPNFVLGPLLVLVFSVKLGWLPVSGAEGPASLVLPAATLGLGMSAILARLVRAAVIEAMSADFIRTARAKGASERAVFLRHALRNALLAVVTILGLELGHVLAGAVVTETIFAWPGLGRLVLEAIQARDYPLVQGAVLCIAATYGAVNLATDLACLWLDPRTRSGA